MKNENTKLISLDDELSRVIDEKIDEIKQSTPHLLPENGFIPSVDYASALGEDEDREFTWLKPDSTDNEAQRYHTSGLVNAIANDKTQIVPYPNEGALNEKNLNKWAEQLWDKQQEELRRKREEEIKLREWQEYGKIPLRPSPSPIPYGLPQKSLEEILRDLGGIQRGWAPPIVNEEAVVNKDKIDDQATEELHEWALGELKKLDGENTADG